MIIPLTRLIVRLSFLFLIVYSIFYFYVLGYRYNLKDSLTYQTAWIYDFIVYGNINYIKVWDKTIFLTDHKVSLYSIPEWACKRIVIWKEKINYCFDGKHYNKIVYFATNSIKIIPFKAKTFFKLDLLSSDDFFDKYKFKWSEIEFVYEKNGDLLYKDDLGYKRLLTLKNIDFVWYTLDGLVFEKTGRLFEIRFE